MDREPIAPSPEQLARVQAAVTASGDTAYDWDLASDALTWSGSPAVVDRLFGRDCRTGAEFLKRILPEDMLVRRRLIEAHFRLGALFDCEYRLKDTSGAVVWIHERGSARRDGAGHPLGVVGTLRVVTQQKKREARLRYDAQHDKLTGFFNRARLADALQDVLTFNQRFAQTGAYFCVGIDRLSIVNDAFGHEAGDAVLIDMAQRLEARPPIGDAIGRVSGDCFGVVVAQCGENDLDAVAERIFHEMRASPVETPSGSVFVTVSIGAAVFAGGDSAHDVMAKAEVALRTAKQAGRDCFVRYRQEDNARRDHKTYVQAAERIQAALREDRFIFAFQPIVTAAGEVAHYECLLRIIDEDGSIKAAGTFMPVVEEMGLIRQTDRKVLEMAARELHRTPGVTLAINVSAYTVGDRTWLQRMHELLEGKPEIARRLIVEITETMAVRDLEESARFVQAIRKLGCGVALDDFGAGYTSFRNLRALAVDEVKIDGSFVRNLADNPDNQVFVRSLVGLARGLNLRTVAECVETEADVRFLSDNGVDYFQGYYFGRPDTKPAWRETPAAKKPDKA